MIRYGTLNIYYIIVSYPLAVYLLKKILINLVPTYDVVINA